jgi:hypothetical protein
MPNVKESVRSFKDLLVRNVLGQITAFIVTKMLIRDIHSDVSVVVITIDETIENKLHSYEF